MSEIDLEKAIEASKNIILEEYEKKSDLKRIRFSNYSRCYFSTTENIKAYLSQISCSKEHVLTALASGDHIFNLISQGARYVDAFDINQLTYFVYYLKRALIMKFSYSEFLSFSHHFFRRKDNEKDLRQDLLKIKSYLPEDVYFYYESLILFNDDLSIQKNFDFYFNFLYYLFINHSILPTCNSYLQNETTYNILKKQLQVVPVHLMFINAIDLPKILKKKYDFILLSNVMDYMCEYYEHFELEEFQKFMQSLYPYLKENGAIVHYTFDVNSVRGGLVDCTHIKKEDLIDGEVVPLSHDYYSDGYYLVRKRGK